MAIEPKRLNSSTLLYETAASVDGDNDLIPVASAANSFKLAKVSPNVLAGAVNKRNAVVNLAHYVTDFTADNSANIALAIAATPVGGTLIGPEADIYTNAIDINKRINVILPGRLVRHSGEIDTLVTISAADAYFRCRDVDYNAEAVVSHAGGRGEAIRVTGARVVIEDTQASNTPYIGTGNVFEIRAPDVKLIRCRAKNAGYAGFRTFEIATLDASNHPIGDCWLIDCVAENYRVKGWVNNRHAGTVYIHNWQSSFNATAAEAASESLLAETGAGYRMWRLVVSNTSLKDGPLSNLAKSDGCRFVDFVSCRLESTATAARVWRMQLDASATVDNYDRCTVTLRNSQLVHRTITSPLASCETSINGNFVMYDVDFVRGAGTTTGEFVECRGTGNWFERCSVSGAAVANTPFCSLRYDGAAALSGDITVIGLENRTADQQTFIRLPDGSPTSDKLRFVAERGNWDVAQTNINRQLVARNLSTPREFAWTAVPTGGSWSRGDIVKNTTPSAAGAPGWVCTTAGLGPVISTTGDITSGTATLVVASATGIAVGVVLDIVGVTGSKTVTGVSGTTITLNSNADATVSGAAVTNNAPYTFKAMASLAA